MRNITVGSICSGIEAASVAWGDLGFKFHWFSEIAPFPSKLLSERYPETPNLGDMCDIPQKILTGDVAAPDLICGGTPCQAFSLAGWKKGLTDDRGNLSLKFVDIIEANDHVRSEAGLPGTIVFWENVEGVLRDKTNAFGCLLASLAGFDHEIVIQKWPQSGLIRGLKRNIAWRVIDAKYFGLPQQRRRLYLMAGDTQFNPEEILFETGAFNEQRQASDIPLRFIKNEHSIELFRSYTDCLYSAYGTKWNGNAAAYNGSLFVLQNGRLRRFTPLECERLMGFPDDYTNIKGAHSTTRYQATGNSWAVPVIRWLGARILKYNNNDQKSQKHTIFNLIPVSHQINLQSEIILYDLGKNPICISSDNYLNGSSIPSSQSSGQILKIIDTNAAEKYYITPVGCNGILRRKVERQLNINQRLEMALKAISSLWTVEKINTISRKQTRGRFSTALCQPIQKVQKPASLTLW
jgi:DNA (cytosine-5)-methyltransferase 1